MAAGKPRWFDSSPARPPAELAEALNIHTRLTNGRTARQRHRRLVSSPPSQISTATPRAILVPLCGADDRGALDRDLTEGNDVDAAATNFDRAIEVARCQNSRFLELRAATSKARLWLDRGRHQSARDLLVPVYSSFSEGLDTADLVEARSLLNELM